MKNLPQPSVHVSCDLRVYVPRAFRRSKAVRPAVLTFAAPALNVTEVQIVAAVDHYAAVDRCAAVDRYAAVDRGAPGVHNAERAAPNVAVADHDAPAVRNVAPVALIFVAGSPPDPAAPAVLSSPVESDAPALPGFHNEESAASLSYSARLRYHVPAVLARAPDE
jgi:hypothetical protein